MNARDTILARIHQIVYNEGRPYSYNDFIASDNCPNEGKYAHGTIRNIFSLFNKEGLIKLVYGSPQAFYTLTEVEFKKGMTPDYRGVAVKYTQETILNI